MMEVFKDVFYSTESWFKAVFHSTESWPVSPLALVALTIPTYLILLSIYRLYFHPLAKFPGPKLPALTGLYEFYYECILGGRYFAEILRMHEQYGNHPFRPD
jgi:hypothetical protein